LSNVKLLDCTLRETPVMCFGSENIKITKRNLELAGVDIIEVALLTNLFDKYEIGSTHVISIDQANDLLVTKKENVIYSICMNQGDFDTSFLPRRSDQGIDAIRYVLMEGRIEEAIADLKRIGNLGYKVMLQHRNIITYSEEEIKRVIEIANELGVFSYSIVDTFGSMYAEDVSRIAKLVNDNLNMNIWMGFHGHNNHMLATSNAEVFVSAFCNTERTIFVDGTVLGAGIGAGNANIELLMLYCNKWVLSHYNVDYIYNIIEKVVPDIKTRCVWGYSILNLIAGEHNVVHLHSNYLKDNNASFSLHQIDEMIQNMPKEYKYRADLSCWNEYIHIKENTRWKFAKEQLKKLEKYAFFVFVFGRIRVVRDKMVKFIRIYKEVF